MAGVVYDTIGWQGVPFQFLARVEGFTGAYILQSEVSTIAYRVIDEADGSEVVSGTQTVANVVFDTLQTDGRWNRDAIGYNFRAQLAGTAFPDNGRRYRVEFQFNMADTTTLGVVFRHLAKQFGGD